MTKEREIVEVVNNSSDRSTESHEKRKKSHKLNTELFIEKAISIHGYKYDYSNSIYNGWGRKIIIRCPKHGDFEQTAGSHLCGRGCKKCSIENNSENRKIPKEVVFERFVKVHGDMYDYSKSVQEKQPCYKNCKVCDEWLLFSNFKRWFEENKVEGYAIDKDLTQHGITNKIYSPSTCNFVPQRINSLLTKNDSHRGEYKIGVQKSHGRYNATMSVIDGCRYIGTFDTEEEAFQAYKREKEKYIKEVADDYFSKGLITERVRDLMYEYEILEND